MEENQVQNPNPNQFNMAGNGKKKKGLGPVGGILLALLIVFLIAVIGLLVRMVIAGDGDYFKPIKSIFGIEDEEDDEDEPKSKKNQEESDSSRSSSGKKPVLSGARYTLLSDDVEDEDVKHYRITIDVKTFVNKLIDEMGSSYKTDDYDTKSQSKLKYDDVSDLKIKPVMSLRDDRLFSYDDDYDDDIAEWDYDEDYDFDSDYDDYDYYSSADDFGVGGSDMDSFLGMGMSMLSEMSDLFAGEMYFDVYFEGNDLVQLVIGYDYADLVENLYEFYVESDPDTKESMKEEGIESASDLAKMINEQFEQYLDEDTLCDMIFESEDAESTLKTMGIKEKDIKDALELYSDEGIIEIYITGTTKLKGLISMALDSEELEEEIKVMEKDTGVKFDEDNMLESVFKAALKTDEYDGYGFEIAEID